MKYGSKPTAKDGHYHYNPDHRHEFIEYEIDRISGLVIEMEKGVAAAFYSFYSGDNEDVSMILDSIAAQSVTAASLCDAKIMQLS